MKRTILMWLDKKRETETETKPKSIKITLIAAILSIGRNSNYIKKIKKKLIYKYLCSKNTHTEELHMYVYPQMSGKSIIKYENLPTKRVKFSIQGEVI